VLLQIHAIQLANGVPDVVALEPDELKHRFSWPNTEGLSLGTLGLQGEGWFDPYGLLQAFKPKARGWGRNISGTR
jgi:sarcosine oxidase